MKVVLLERVENLGAIGDVVSVKDGFARNFLLPRDKARRATAANLKAFEVERAAIEARNEKNKAEAQKIADKIDGQTYVMIRQAGETGQLYGSVAGRDVAEAVQAEGGKVEMPMTETFWAHRWGFLHDRYGKPWMVNCMKPMPTP